MPLSWNEIKSRAIAFSKEWENEVSEDAEAKSFWDDLINGIGIWWLGLSNCMIIKRQGCLLSIGKTKKFSSKTEEGFETCYKPGKCLAGQYLKLPRMHPIAKWTSNRFL